VGLGSRTDSGHAALRVIPKGLRSFDAQDADFFLELLPGPRDRDGLPDGLRFWKSRAEATDPDQTIAVGLIYGPSGCGKSSLVKAGLLPRLAAHVHTVYVEATPDQTEARLLRELRKAIPGLLSVTDLPEALAALRRGHGLERGHKVLIVLDQFEQWLHGQRQQENPELVRALRQCDGGGVQCLLLVRDDFWMAVTRFMRDLEVRLIEGQNSAAADLFDLDHARKVLAAFGRAFGKLPEDRAEVTKEQKEFLNEAVRGLARDGKVICVRLALFAEMVKRKPWLPATLKEVGGVEGVGLTFLEETFSASTAPLEHRYHQRAARAVLKALLPDKGTDIRGHMRSEQQLQELSGYADRPREWEELLQILDGELRLVTPTDPESQAGEGPAPPAAVGGKCFQLTHDYLVHSLRDWLTRKQKETRRGRAELRLAERSVAWSARPESRHLPAWWEWLNIRLFARKKDWTLPQRKMMSKAARHYGVRLGALGVLLVLMAAAGVRFRNQLIQENQETHARGLVKRVLDADIARVPEGIKEMAGFREWTDPLLQEAYAEADRAVRESKTQSERVKQARRQLHASLALVGVDPGQAEFLKGRLLNAETPEEVLLIRDALREHAPDLKEDFWKTLKDSASSSQRLRAACALAVLAPDDLRWRNEGDKVVKALIKEPDVLLHLRNWTEVLREVNGKLMVSLLDVFRNPELPESKRAVATALLADYAAEDPDALANLICDAEPWQYATLFPKLETNKVKADVIVSLKKELSKIWPPPEEDPERLAKRQANAAVALLQLGEEDKVWPLFRQDSNSDPRLRSYLIHRLKTLGSDPEVIVRRLLHPKKPLEVSEQRALLLALGGFEAEFLKDHRQLKAKVFELFEDPDPGVHGAAEWLLRKMGREEDIQGAVRAWARQGESRLKPIKKGRPQWYVNGQLQTLVVFPGPVPFRMGTPKKEIANKTGYEVEYERAHFRLINRTFAISTTEITKEQFLALQEDPEEAKRFFNRFHVWDDQCPVNRLTWNEAARYCNLLSEKEGIPPNDRCYELIDEKNPAAGMRPRPKCLDLPGYRLPTEAEWEYACRAGSQTIWPFGDSEELLEKYAWDARISMDEGLNRVGWLKPNDFGLFDMLGNTAEWCQAGWGEYPEATQEKPYVDRFDPKKWADNGLRVARGGSFLFQPMLMRSGSRFPYPPGVFSNLFGLRVARTIIPAK
jgi:formylglycine-generating enzyme required for sulfatase activity